MIGAKQHQRKLVDMYAMATSPKPVPSMFRRDISTKNHHSGYRYAPAPRRNRCRFGTRNVGYRTGSFTQLSSGGTTPGLEKWDPRVGALPPDKIFAPVHLCLRSRCIAGLKHGSIRPEAGWKFSRKGQESEQDLSTGGSSRIYARMARNDPGRGSAQAVVAARKLLLAKTGAATGRKGRRGLAHAIMSEARY